MHPTVAHSFTSTILNNSTILCTYVHFTWSASRIDGFGACGYEDMRSSVVRISYSNLFWSLEGSVASNILHTILLQVFPVNLIQSFYIIISALLHSSVMERTSRQTKNVLKIPYYLSNSALHQFNMVIINGMIQERRLTWPFNSASGICWLDRKEMAYT